MSSGKMGDGWGSDGQVPAGLLGTPITRRYQSEMARRAEMVGKLIESLEKGSRALGPLLMPDSSFEVVAIAAKQLAQSNREALLILLDVLADMRDGGVGPKMLPALREYLDAGTKGSGNGSGR